MTITQTKTGVRRLVVLLSIGAIIFAAAGFYLHFYLYHPIGRGPAGPLVDRQAFEKVWSDRPVKLVGFGDSMTAGFGASARHSYFDRLVANPSDEFPELANLNLSRVLPNLTPLNIALSGSTSLEQVDYLLPKIPLHDDQTFGLFVMTVGGNDVIHNYGRTPPREGAMYGARLAEAQPWITNFEERLDRMLTVMRERFPGGCHFFLANIYDPTDEDGDAINAGLPRWPEGLAVLKAYNDVLARCAEKFDDVELVNIHDLFLGHGIHCLQFWHRHYQKADPTYWYYDNLEDPHDRGYDAIRRLMLIEMARVLPERLRN